MKNEVIARRLGVSTEEFVIVFEGRVLKPTWMTKGPAQAALTLLEEGYGHVDCDGNIIWKAGVVKPPKPEDKP